MAVDSKQLRQEALTLRARKAQHQQRPSPPQHTVRITWRHHTDSHQYETLKMPKQMDH